MSELRAAHRRIMNMVCRGVVEESNDEPGLQQVKISLLRDEAKASVERFQNYGFSSNPPADTEVLCVFVGGGRDHGVIVATDDRATRFTGLAAGEVAIYSDEGDSITLKRDNLIEIAAAKKIKIAVVEGEIDIESKGGKITISEALAIDATTIRIKGNVEVDGNLTATGSISAPGGSVGGGS